MNIIVNGEVQCVAAANLKELCTAMGYEGVVIATALNGDFVPAGERENKLLRDDDRVEILTPRQGG
jgi:sulfur carrier protein